MSNVLYIDGVPWPIGAKVIRDDGKIGEIVLYGTPRGGFDDSYPLKCDFEYETYYCGPNAEGKYHVGLLNPPASTETVDPMEEEHSYDEPEATV